MSEIMVSMWLPLPSPTAIEEFRELLKSDYGVTVDEDRLVGIATSVLHLAFLTAYGSRYLRPQIDGKRGPTGPEPGGSTHGSSRVGKPRRRSHSSGVR